MESWIRFVVNVIKYIVFSVLAVAAFVIILVWNDLFAW